MKFLKALLVLTCVSAFADDFQRYSSPELLEKSYEAMEKVEVPWEIGKSTFTVKVDCQASQADAKATLEASILQIQKLFDQAGADLKLGSQNEKWGYDLAAPTFSSPHSPVATVLDNDKNQYFFTNTCTGKQDAKPFRENNVYSAAKVISVWFPNTGTTLNHLSLLVSKVEALSEPAADGVKINCHSTGGSNFDLAVTKATQDSVWAKIEAIAKQRAEAKAKADLSNVGYNQVWEGSGNFSRGASTALPHLSVSKEGGVWQGKCTQSQNFTVCYSQSSDPLTEKGQLKDQKSYEVQASAATKEGLYGILKITVSQECQASKAAAEAAIADVSEEILAKLRAINGGLTTETDKLKIGDRFGRSYNPTTAYPIIDANGDESRRFYNRCDLSKIYDVSVQPKVEAWQGVHEMTIFSSDLDALTQLSEEVAADYATDNDDPSQLRVFAGVPTYSAKLSVLEALGSQLESDAYNAFRAPGSEYSCDAGKYSYACLAGGNRGILESAPGGAAFDVGPQNKSAYSESASDVSADERGVAVFKGKYTITKVLRKVLVDHRN